MTERKRETQTELETLYHKAGDVEPDGGLDRVIRARAEEASRKASKPGRLPWLGGLVTASVAIVAIAVVLQQSPPSQPAPEAGAPLERSAPEAYMAPSMGAQSQQEVSADADRARAESHEEEESAFRADRTQTREALQDAATETRPRPTAQPETEPAAPPAEADDSAPDRLTGARLNATDNAALKSGDALVEKLRELIEAGRMDDARRLRDEARDLDPELELPEDIEQALRRPDSDGPDDGPDSGMR